ncbi:hypothetical protein KRR40_40225 [Niabella defluvii]|nr:hypothetical protein KRR40_40225 [Niabella sp. I65]
MMETVPDYAEKATGLLYFPDIYTACQAIVPISETGAAAIELMDRASLRSVEHVAGLPLLSKIYLMKQQRFWLNTGRLPGSS